MNLKKISLISLLAAALWAQGADELAFQAVNGRADTLAMAGGRVVAYTAYEGIPYVTNVEDPQYQTLNIFVPAKTVSGRVPVLLRNNVGGYMSCKAGQPRATDATGRALLEGYVVCIPGTRGSNATVERDGQTVYTGIAPNGLLDLKAVVRWLRHNAAVLGFDPDLIFSDGTSAGGAMSSLLGATGNHPDYQPLLQAMGAADERDDVYGAVCYCPITDLDHADMEYEWLYGSTNVGVRHLNGGQVAVSDALAALCPDYINSLGLTNPQTGEAITADNYKEYLASFLLASASRAAQEGVVIPDTIGVKFFGAQPAGMMPGMQPGQRPEMRGERGGDRGNRGGGDRPKGDRPRMDRGEGGFPGGGNMPPMMAGGMRTQRKGDIIDSIDLDVYLAYVASTTPLKTPPAFDSMGVLGAQASRENSVFGDAAGQPANFTDFSLEVRLRDSEAEISPEMAQRVKMMNPMRYIDDPQAVKAPNWFIRHGAMDRDTSFLVPINLATKLQNEGIEEVDFFIPWGRPHSGDYNLDDLFGWIARVRR